LKKTDGDLKQGQERSNAYSPGSLRREEGSGITLPLESEPVGVVVGRNVIVIVDVEAESRVTIWSQGCVGSRRRVDPMSDKSWVERGLAVAGLADTMVAVNHMRSLCINIFH
jgi:hypothetical protein